MLLLKEDDKSGTGLNLLGEASMVSYKNGGEEASSYALLRGFGTGAMKEEERLQGLALRSYAPLQAHFLRRLIQLRQRRTACAQQSPVDPWLLAVLDRAVYATYRDCVEMGLGEEARRVLARGVEETRSDN